jgi:hypothetical protein
MKFLTGLNLEQLMYQESFDLYLSYQLINRVFTVNDDRSAEKGLGYYEEHEAVIFTPNADLDLTASVSQL